MKPPKKGTRLEVRPAERVVVYERTSGDEDQGQDAAAQTAQTVHRALAAGYEVVGKHTDEDVKGDSPWKDREGLSAALKQVHARGAVLLVREPSRLWRGSAARGLLAIEELPDLEVLGKGYWRRRGGVWVADKEAGANELLRFVDLWASWLAKRDSQVRTTLALAEIRAGRRATKSGRPLGRPRVEVPAEHLDAARAVLEGGGSWSEAREAVRRSWGYYEVTTDAARAKRDVSRSSLQRLLG